jgi:hypothetical protein
MATKKVKKFGRGGDILTGLGAGLLGYAAYKKLTEGKDKDSDSGLKKPKISDEVDKAQESSRKKTIQSEDERFKGAEKGDVTAKSDTGATTSIKKSESYKAEPGVGIAKGVDEKELARLQRRNAPVTKKKERYEGQKFPTDDVIGAGQRYKDIGRSTEPKPVEKSLKDLGATKLPSSSNAAKEEPTKLLSKPYPTGVKGSEKDPYLEPKTLARTRAGTLVKTNEPNPEAVAKARAARAAMDKKQREEFEAQFKPRKNPNRSYNKGGAVKKYASGGSVSSASKRADGIAMRGKTRGKVL